MTQKQLQRHLFFNGSIIQCGCSHKHKNVFCNLKQNQCGKCGNNQTILLTPTQFKYHNEGPLYLLICEHTHTHDDDYTKCNITIRAECFVCSTPTQYISGSENLSYHLYTTNIRVKLCRKHMHVHSEDPRPCMICDCNDAILMEEGDPFVIKMSDGSSFMIYKPKLWSHTARNNFYMFLKAVLYNDNSLEKYKTFLASPLFYGNRMYPNFTSIKSGKISIQRRQITGAMSLHNIYQTATIGQDLMFNEIFIPPKIWSLIVDDYYLDLVVMKRDPCLDDVCMLVMKPRQGNNDTIKISGEITKVLNQDQDGDKNNIPLRKKFIGLYDTSTSYNELMTRLELEKAHKTLRTPLNKSKIEFSEYTKLVLYDLKHGIEFNGLIHHPFIKYIRKYNHEQLMHIALGYEFEMFYDFYKHYIEANKQQSVNLFTIKDLEKVFTSNKHRLKDIVDSKSKGSLEHIETFKKMFLVGYTDKEHKAKGIEHFNTCVSAGQKLGDAGRRLFSVMFSAENLISVGPALYINTRLIASLVNSTSILYFLFEEGTLFAFWDDIFDIEL